MLPVVPATHNQQDEGHAPFHGLPAGGIHGTEHSALGSGSDSSSKHAQKTKRACIFLWFDDTLCCCELRCGFALRFNDCNLENDFTKYDRPKDRRAIWSGVKVRAYSNGIQQISFLIPTHHKHTHTQTQDDEINVYIAHILAHIHTCIWIRHIIHLYLICTYIYIYGLNLCTCLHLWELTRDAMSPGTCHGPALWPSRGRSQGGTIAVFNSLTSIQFVDVYISAEIRMGWWLK